MTPVDIGHPDDADMTRQIIAELPRIGVNDFKLHKAIDPRRGKGRVVCGQSHPDPQQRRGRRSLLGPVSRHHGTNQIRGPTRGYGSPGERSVSTQVEIFWPT